MQWYFVCFFLFLTFVLCYLHIFTLCTTFQLYTLRLSILNSILNRSDPQFKNSKKGDQKFIWFMYWINLYFTPQIIVKLQKVLIRYKGRTVSGSKRIYTQDCCSKLLKLNSYLNLPFGLRMTINLSISHGIVALCQFALYSCSLSVYINEYRTPWHLALLKNKPLVCLLSF